MPRWNAPVIPTTIEPEQGSGIHLSGVPRQDVRLVLKDEDVDRLRLGYVCLKCLEPHEVPFPRTCFVCGYAMKANQSRDFAIDYGGEVAIGASTSVDEEIDRMRTAKAQKIWVPGMAR